MGIRPKNFPDPHSQIAQDVLEQTKMTFQDVRKDAMQAYQIQNVLWWKKANASKLKQAHYVYV